MFVLILAAAALAVVVGAVVAVRRSPAASARQWPRLLQWAGLAAAVLAAAVLGPATARDSGWFAAVLLGVPVVLAALPLLWEATLRRGSIAVAWLAAVAATVWAVLLALGIGLAFLPAASLLLGAAAAGTAAGTAAGPAPATRSGAPME